jgi:hypothetical protein
MTPKEKAQQLIYAFEAFTDSANEYKFAIQCATIAVDEILNLNDIDMEYSFYAEVRQELEKLF